MNEPTIEKLLQKAPQARPPARLLQRLQADIDLPQTTTRTNHKSRVSSHVLRRWLPALGFALWFLGCIVVFGIQASHIAELKRANEKMISANPAAALQETERDRAVLIARELEQLRKDAADVQRLRTEVEQLRAQIGELVALREQNQQLRTELKAQAPPLPKPEEDFFAQAANRADRIKCVNNLKQVGLAARLWANSHPNDGSRLPMDYESMKSELNTDKVTFCPADQSKRYEILLPGASEGQPQVVYTRCPIHNNGGLWDGSFQQLSPPLTVVQKNGQWVI